MSTKKNGHPPQSEVKEGFSEPHYLMIDLSCLEDICGDPNVLVKPLEHTVWVVVEGRLEIFFVA